MKWITWPFAKIRPFKIFQVGAGRHLGFDITRNSPIRSTDPENHTLESNISVSDHSLRRYGHSCIKGANVTPILGRGGRRGSAMVPFETATVVSYKLSIATIALSVTIRPQFAIECLQHSNLQGGSGSLWAQISGCSLWRCLGLQRANAPR